MNMKTKLNNLLSELNHGFIGREEMVKSALLTMIAGENLLLIGPPGTGKSLIARQISQALAQPETPNQAYFEYLLTKFSTPEELFGPLSISELKQDRFHRNTQGYLPTVQVAFLDEIFKASSSILNALLTILNERKFHNGTQTQNIPLQALIAASNELPKGQAELSALYDRFLVRRFVDYVGENQLQDFFRLPEKRAISPENQLSRNELAEIQQNAAKVVFPEPIQAALLAIWAKHKETFKENADERLSDRRFAKILHLLRISAFTNQREQVDLSDLFLLKDCLWNDETNAEKVRELIMDVLRQCDQQIPSDTNETPQTTTQFETGNKFQGLKGMGTEHNPILIQNIQDLQQLAKPEIGAANLYFKQTADIVSDDFSTIQKFTGQYDGGGYELNFKNKKHKVIFARIENAVFKNLTLTQSVLSLFANSSKLFNIQSQKWALIGDIAENCTFTACKMPILAGQVQQCTIEFCFFPTHKFLLASGLVQESEISNCWFSGAGKEEYSNIRGIHKNSFTKCFFLKTSIFRSPFYEIKRNNTTSNIMTQGQNFSEYLKADWDFDNIWEWDSVKNYPTLRPELFTEEKQAMPATQHGSNTQSLLLAQFKNNIWL